MPVTIISYNCHSERVCASAARLSTTEGDALHLFATACDKSKNCSLIEKVLSSGHASVIEHIYFTIAFSNVSAIVEQFMIEFRLASFTVKSRRYVNFTDQGYYIPEILDKELTIKYKNVVGTLFETYSKLLLEGIPKEDARFILPYCFHSNFYCTVNARELIYIILEMQNGRGKGNLELNSIANQLLSAFESDFPFLLTYISKLYKETKSSEKSIRYVPCQKNLQEVKAEIKLLHFDKNSLDRVRYARNMYFSTSTLATNETDHIKSFEVISQGNCYNRELEFTNGVFEISNLSLSGLTHLERHRMQSLIIPPIRSVRTDKFIIPPSISMNQKAQAMYLKAIKLAKSFRETLLRDVPSIQEYLCLSGNVINVMTQMNGREFDTFFRLRACNRAQWEIRDIANTMLKELRQQCPDIFNHMGPSCAVLGYCPEGKLSCGNPFMSNDHQN